MTGGFRLAGARQVRWLNEMLRSSKVEDNGTDRAQKLYRAVEEESRQAMSPTRPNCTCGDAWIDRRLHEMGVACSFSDLQSEHSR